MLEAGTFTPFIPITTIIIKVICGGDRHKIVHPYFFLYLRYMLVENHINKVFYLQNTVEYYDALWYTLIRPAGVEQKSISAAIFTIHQFVGIDKTHNIYITVWKYCFYNKKNFSIFTFQSSYSWQVSLWHDISSIQYFVLFFRHFTLYAYL